MALIPSLGNDTVDRFENGQPVEVTASWRNFFSAAFTALTGLTQSGTTAKRPTTLLWTGRPYFDTTLNRPIWYTGSSWIKADGTVV